MNLSGEENSKMTSIPLEQIEMLKQLDLKPKFTAASKTETSIIHIHNHMNEKKQEQNISKVQINDKMQNISLQDCLSPRYTDVINELAAKNDEIEKSKASEPIMSMPVINITESSSVVETKASNTDSDPFLSLGTELKNSDSKNLQINQLSNILQKEDSPLARSEAKNIPQNPKDESDIKSQCLTDFIQEEDSQETDVTLKKQEMQGQNLISCKPQISCMPTTSNLDCELRQNSLQNSPVVQENKGKVGKGKMIAKSSKVIISSKSSVRNPFSNKNSSSIENECGNVKDDVTCVSEKQSDRPPFPIEVETKVIDNADAAELTSDTLKPIAKNKSEDDDLNNRTNIEVAYLNEPSISKDQESIQIDNWNEMNLIVTESEEITPENVAELIADGHIRSHSFSKKGVNGARKIEEKKKRKKTIFADSRLNIRTSPRISIEEKSNTGDKAESRNPTFVKDYADILKKEVVIKLFKLPIDEIMKHTSQTVVPRNKINHERVQIIDMLDIVETDQGREECFEMTRSLLKLDQSPVYGDIEIKVEEDDHDKNNTNYPIIESSPKAAKKRGRKKKIAQVSNNDESSVRIKDFTKDVSTENDTSSVELNLVHPVTVSHNIPEQIKKRGRPKKSALPNSAESNEKLNISGKLLSLSSPMAEVSLLPHTNEFHEKKGRRKKIVVQSTTSEDELLLQNHLENKLDERKLLNSISSLAEESIVLQTNQLPKKRGRKKKVIESNTKENELLLNISDSNEKLNESNKLSSQSLPMAEGSPILQANELPKKRGRKKKINVVESNTSEDESNTNKNELVPSISESNEKLNVSNKLSSLSLPMVERSPLLQVNELPKKRGRKKKVNAESNTSEDESNTNKNELIPSISDTNEKLNVSNTLSSLSLPMAGRSPLFPANELLKKRGRKKKINVIESNTSEDDSHTNENELVSNISDTNEKLNVSNTLSSLSLPMAKRSPLFPANESPKKRGRKKKINIVESNTSEDESHSNENELVPNISDTNEKLNVSNKLSNQSLPMAARSPLPQVNESPKKRGRKKKIAVESTTSEDELLSPNQTLPTAENSTLPRANASPKKRGRKRKNVTETSTSEDEFLLMWQLENEVEASIPKKRGRKKKQAVEIHEMKETMLIPVMQSSAENLIDAEYVPKRRGRKKKMMDSKTNVSNDEMNDSKVLSDPSSVQSIVDTPLLQSPGIRKSSRKLTNVFGTKYECFVSEISASKIVSSIKGNEVLENKSPQKSVHYEKIVNKAEANKPNLLKSPRRLTLKTENFVNETETQEHNSLVSPRRKVLKEENLFCEIEQSSPNKMKRTVDLPNKTELSMVEISEITEISVPANLKSENPSAIFRPKSKRNLFQSVKRESCELQVIDEAYKDIKDLKILVPNQTRSPVVNVNKADVDQKTKKGRVPKNSDKAIFACSKINVPHRIFSNSNFKSPTSTLSVSVVPNKTGFPNKSHTNVKSPSNRYSPSANSFSNAIKYSAATVITPSNSEIAQLKEKLIPKSENGIKRSGIGKISLTGGQSESKVKLIEVDSGIKSVTGEINKTASQFTPGGLFNSTAELSVVPVNKVESSLTPLSATNECQLSSVNDSTKKRKRLSSDFIVYGQSKSSPKADKTKSSTADYNISQEIKMPGPCGSKGKSKSTIQNSKLQIIDAFGDAQPHKPCDTFNATEAKTVSDPLRGKESPKKSICASVTIKKERPSDEESTNAVLSSPHDALDEISPYQLPAHIASTVDSLVDFYLSKTYSFFGFGGDEYRQ